MEIIDQTREYTNSYVKILTRYSIELNKIVLTTKMRLNLLFDYYISEVSTFFKKCFFKTMAFVNICLAKIIIYNIYIIRHRIRLIREKRENRIIVKNIRKVARSFSREIV